MVSQFNKIYGVGTFLCGGFLTYSTITHPKIYERIMYSEYRKLLTFSSACMLITGPLTIYKKKPNFANGNWICTAIISTQSFTN